MKHKLFKCGRLSGMLLGAAALLAMVTLMSVPALAEEPGAAYAASSTPAESNSDGMDFTPTANYWNYYNEKGERKQFSPNDVDWNITARDWKWYGKAEGDIQPNTLEILNDFDLYTTDNYAIKLPAGSTVIFHADVLLESKVNCIYSEGSITLKGVSKNNDRHKLTFGSAGISSGLDVTVENLKLKTDPESVESYEHAIEANRNLRLQECYFYAGDEWKGKNVVNCDTYNISRDVNIDIPGSYFTSISGSGNYIADIAYVSNVIFDDGTEIRIGEIYLNITNTLSPADESARMELITNTFWTADYGKYIYEEAMSDTDSGSYKTLGGKPMSWNDIGNHLSKLPENSSAKISLNGKTTLPEAVISAIKDRKLTVEFVYDSVKSWVVRGDKIGTVSAAEFAAFPGNADSSALRGVFGVDLKVGGTKVPAELKLAFRKGFAGQFANVYKLNGGVLEFQRCVKVGADATAVIPGADAAGEYVVMVCEFSDVPGDADNDGVLSALDASAVLKEAVGMAKSANAAVCDFNGDGEVNALDAAAVLKAVVGIR